MVMARERKCSRKTFKQRQCECQAKKKKKIQPGYGAYNAKAQNCVPNVFRREMERQIMQPGDVKTEDRVVVIVNQVEEIYMIAS
jgi:hypothetical protein